jgi:hypothetical protein
MASNRVRCANLLVVVFLWLPFALQFSAEAHRASDQDKPKLDDKRAGKCTMSSETLVSKEWRLHSFYLEIQPSDGWPFKFLPDGKVETKNFSLITHWKIETDRVTLLDDNGREEFRFRLDEEYCILMDIGCDAERQLPTLIAPRGLDVFGYLTKKCPQKFKRGL